MKRSGTIGFLAGVALALSLAGAQTPAVAPAPAPGPVPHLKFDSTVLSLGDIVRGQDAVAEFVYTNTGDAPLKILSAKPG